MMRATTCNVNRANALRSEELVERVSALAGRGIVGLQEVDSWGDDASTPGYELITGTSRSGLLVPREIRASIRGRFVTEHHACAIFGRSGICSRLPGRFR